MAITPACAEQPKMKNIVYQFPPCNLLYIGPTSFRIYFKYICNIINNRSIRRKFPLLLSYFLFNKTINTIIYKA